jgi:dienelactone hydrolase
MKFNIRISIFVLFVLFSFTNLHAQLAKVAYSDGAQKLNGELAVPVNSTKKKAGILILPAWKGIDENSRSSAKELSANGYYAFIADIYGEGNYPQNSKEAGAKAGYYKKNIKEYQQRIRLALEQLIKAGADSARIVVIGYCFGGTGALEAARCGLPVKGVVSFHGGLSRDTTRSIEPIKAKVLVLHGADDPNVPVKDILAFQNEMRAAKADWQMVYYANAVHSFTDPAAGNDNSKGAAYNATAAKRSWVAFMQFLEETLE